MAGIRADGRALKKHKKDVFRLAQLLGPEMYSVLADSIRADMIDFCAMAQDEGVPLKQIGVPLTLDEAIELLRRVYGL